ncbi:flippase [Spirosoma rigui]|uniref:flippase n=1 Tax=Spirosoma rigui TaxID=564064 RepID=UPI0014751CDC|nr:flippase [Spirosoma rigui]
MITLPYLVRTIGIEKFGAVSYALTIMAYIAILIDYGFMMSATRQVAIYRTDLVKLSALFSTVTIARMILFFIGALCLFFLTQFVPRFSGSKSLYLYGIVFPLGIALMPTWLYQGLEQMRQITYLNIVAKLITIVLLFSVVNSPNDYKYILGIYGIANVVSGVYGLIMAVRRYKLTFDIPKSHEIIGQYKIGFNLFLTSVTVALVNNVNLLILAGYVDNHSLGNYGLAEKIIFAVWQVLAVFSTAIYPVLCRLAQESHELLRRFLIRTFVPFCGCVLAGCIGICFFAEEIIYLIAKTSNLEAVNILRIMIFVPFIVCLNIPTYQTQLANSITQENTRIYGYAAVLNVILCVTLVSIWGTVGAAITMLITQFIITGSLYFVTEVKFPQYSLLRFHTSREINV